MNSVTEPCVTRVLPAAFLSCRGFFFSFSSRPQLINENNYKKIILHLHYCNLHLNNHQCSVNVFKCRKKAEDFLEALRVTVEAMMQRILQYYKSCSHTQPTRAKHPSVVVHCRSFLHFPIFLGDIEVPVHHCLAEVA